MSSQGEIDAGAGLVDPGDSVTAGMPGGESPAPDSPARLFVSEGVRLVSSARFVADTVVVPAGVTPRDLTGFAEGEVEFLSLFPMEAVAWGYLTERVHGHVRLLAYAALREQVQAHGDDSLSVMIPFFACLCGLKWQRTTWVFLLEPDCLTLLRFPARSVIPDCVRSRFTGPDSMDESAVRDARQSLLDAAPLEDGEHVEEGLYRCAGIERRGNRSVLFRLEHTSAPGGQWHTWKRGRLAQEATLLAADIRDSAFLAQERDRRHGLRHLRLLLQVAAVLAMLLGVAHVRYMISRRALAERVRLVEGRRGMVKALEEKDAMIRSTARLSDPALEAFDWLMAMNDLRKESMSFSSTTFTRDGQIGVSGEAPSVAIVNQYVQSLREAGHYAAVDVRDMQSTQRGVNFTLAVRVLPGGPFAKEAGQ